MATKGKYFRISETFDADFNAWCEARPWLNQGALIEILLRYVMGMESGELMRMLEEGRRKWLATATACDAEASGPIDADIETVILDAAEKAPPRRDEHDKAE